MTTDQQLAVTAAELYAMTSAGPLDDESERTVAAMLRTGAEGEWLRRRFELPVHDARPVLSARALVSLFLLDENVVWAVSHPALRRDVLAHLRELIEGTHLALGVERFYVANGEERIRMVRGNWLRIAARSNHGGRGLSAGCLIAEDVQHGEDLAEVAPVIAASPNGQMVVAYRPVRAS